MSLSAFRNCALHRAYLFLLALRFMFAFLGSDHPGVRTRYDQRLDVVVCPADDVWRFAGRRMHFHDLSELVGRVEHRALDHQPITYLRVHIDVPSKARLMRPAIRHR